MIDFERIVGFDWDQGNDRKSSDKHGISRSEAEQVLFNDPLLLVEDTKHSQLEPRVHAIGMTNIGRLVHVTFTLRHGETKIRVIPRATCTAKRESPL